MVKVNSGCKHRWRKDQEELVCIYCGLMLYRNRNPTGPRWLPPQLGDKPPRYKGDRAADKKERPKKWGTPDN
jgi:hypothetical protein